MKKTNTHKSATRGTKLEDLVRLGSDFTPSREHYYNGVRLPLSRRAKALLKLLAEQLPKNVMEHLTWELASEARSDQNMLAQQLFNILVEAHVNNPDDARLSLKLDELASLVCVHLNQKTSVDW